MDPACKVLHISGSSSDFRGIMYQDNSDTTTNENIGTLFSTWVTLQAGQKYYIETSHFFQGTSHLTVGVEIEPASGPIANHPKTKPQR